MTCIFQGVKSKHLISCKRYKKQKKSKEKKKAMEGVQSVIGIQLDG